MESIFKKIAASPLIGDRLKFSGGLLEYQCVDHSDEGEHHPYVVARRTQLKREENGAYTFVDSTVRVPTATWTDLVRLACTVERLASIDAITSTIESLTASLSPPPA